MSNYQKKPGDGTIWNNDRKEKDTHPDRKGDVLLECPHCQKQFDAWISGWIKRKQDGEQFLSLSVKAKDAPPGDRTAPPARSAPPRASVPGNDDAGDEIPF